jgi:ribonuclease E
VESVAEPGAEQPELPPIYTGPTPANPFGGEVFDIFDVLEQAERAAGRPIAAAPLPEPISRHPAEPIFEFLTEPVAKAPPEPMPEHLPEPTAEHLSELAPEPVTMASELVPELVADPPAPPVPANDATPEPLIKPVLVGAEEDAPAAEKKRGWWRR